MLLKIDKMGNTFTVYKCYPKIILCSMFVIFYDNNYL